MVRPTFTVILRDGRRLDAGMLIVTADCRVLAISSGRSESIDPALIERVEVGNAEWCPWCDQGLGVFCQPIKD